MLLDLYEILDIPDDSDDAEIKAAYRRQVKRFHPDLADRNEAGAKARHEALTRLVNRAYEVLSDPEQRRVYDRERADYLEGQRALRPWDPAHPPDFDEIAEMEETDYHPPMTASERQSLRLTAYAWWALGMAVLIEFLFGYIPLGEHLLGALAARSLLDALWLGGQLALITGLGVFILAQIRPEAAERAPLAAAVQISALLICAGLAALLLAFDQNILRREAALAARLIITPPALLGLAVVMLDQVYIRALVMIRSLLRRDQPPPL